MVLPYQVDGKISPKSTVFAASFVVSFQRRWNDLNETARRTAYDNTDEGVCPVPEGLTWDPLADWCHLDYMPDFIGEVTVVVITSPLLSDDTPAIGHGQPQIPNWSPENCPDLPRYYQLDGNPFDPFNCSP